MSSPPRARNNSRSITTDSPPQPVSPALVASRSSPTRQHDSSPPKMPMPLHTRTAGVLRIQSPSTGQQLPYSHQNFIGRTSTPLSRVAAGPYGYPHSSLLSLDPASLSPVPDSVAVAEIRRIIPKIPARAGMRDVYAMVEALRQDGLGCKTTPSSAPSTERTPRSESLPQDAISSEKAGAEFDAFPNSLAGDGVDDPDMAVRKAGANER